MYNKWGYIIITCILKLNPQERHFTHIDLVDKKAVATGVVPSPLHCRRS